jgi:hypothetical protein
MTIPTAANRVCHTCGVAWQSWRDPDPCWSCGTLCGHGCFSDLYRAVGSVGSGCAHRNTVGVGE